VWSDVRSSGESPLFGCHSIDSTPLPGPRGTRGEEVSDLQSTRVPQISPLKRIMAQLVIVLSLRLVKIILSREGVVFYSYGEK
jgi:hypothetical protein